MFRKLYLGAAAGERPHLFSLTDFCLAAVSRMTEFTAMLLVFAFLAPRLFAALNASLGKTPSEILVVLASAAVVLLARLPFVMARSQLRNAFGLDPRPFWRRLKPRFLWSLLALPALALLSLALFYALVSLNVLIWGLLYLLLVYLVCLALFLRPLFLFTLRPERFRPAQDDEVPRGVDQILKLLPEEGGKRPRPNSVWIDLSFQEGLQPPRVSGGRLLIPEKALSAFPPPALRTQIVIASLAYLVKVPRNLKVYRLLSLALGAPVVLILLNSLGLAAGYPSEPRVNLVALIWMGSWASAWFSEFSGLLLRRALNLKLSAAAVTVTRDVPGLFESVDVLARYNMEPSGSSFFLDLFRPRPSPETQLKRLKDSLMELTGEAERSRERSRKERFQKSSQKKSGPTDGKGPGDGGDGAAGGTDADSLNGDFKGDPSHLKSN
ncbi:MAG: hypothetical protein LBR53_05195 [Deltaproteobacteria bacterium]|jgi:hypothetical protein|nr:hypothetical protein [Deltaproteobacteria bacterium]